jgi:peptide/nickel transport system permease protein
MTSPVATVPADDEGSASAGSQSAAPSRRRRPHIGFWIAATWIVGLIVLALFADQLSFIRLPTTAVKSHGRSTAGYKIGPGWTAWFGVDTTGRDVFAKAIYGARTTLKIGLAATLIGLVVGTTMGIVGGYFRGWADRVITIVIDIMLAIPPLVLAIVIVFRVSDLQKTHSGLRWFTKTEQITLVLCLLAIAPLARIVRALTLSLSQREFVLAARSIGARNYRILTREILPNLVPAMMSVAFTSLALLIAGEATLAFLGFSVDVGTPTWGKMINASYNDMQKAWWATFFPSMVLFLTVLSFNVVGDRIARHFDIREASL